MSKTCVNCQKKVNMFNSVTNIDSLTWCLNCIKEDKKTVKEEIKRSKKNDQVRKYQGIVFDNTTKKMLYSGSKGVLNVDYSDIVAYTPVREGHSQNKKHTLTRVATGAFLAGGIGAAVGAFSGSGKNYAYIDRLAVSISLKNGGNVEISLCEATFKSSTVQPLIKEQNEICSLLDSIIADNQVQQQPNDNNVNQLKRLKELVDQGVITQNEFETKKKQILGI